MKKEMKSTVTLLAFILASVILIGLTYTVTAGPLAEQRLQLEAGAVKELLPDTQRIAEVDLGEDDSTLVHLVGCYNGEGEFIGYVFTAKSRGFGGEIEMMVAFDPQGVIQGLRIIEQFETVGFGAEIEEEWFTQQFIGRYGMLFGSRNATSPSEIDMVSGATISTDAVLRGINDASAYLMGDEAFADTIQALGVGYMPEIKEFWPDTDSAQRIDMAISLDANGEIIGYVFYVSPMGYNPIDMAIAIDTEGVIRGIQILHHNETWNIGAIAIEDEDFLQQFIGRSGILTAVRNAEGPQEIDAVSMATLTVDGILQGVNDSIEFFNKMMRDN